MVALAAAVAAESPIAVVIALTALSSVAGAAERPAAMALLPRLVGEARLGPANALLHTVQELGVVVGPAIGAILLTVAATWVAFAVNALTFVRLGAARRAAAPTPGRTGDGRDRACGLPAQAGLLHDLAHGLCRADLPDRGHGRAHLRRADRAAGALRRSAARTRGRGVRVPARRRGLRWAAEHRGQCTALHEQCRVAHRGGDRRAVLCDAAGVRAVRPRRRRPAGHGARWHRTGRLRGRRRDDPRARRPGGRARPRDGVLRLADGRGDGRRSRARPRAHQPYLTVDEPPGARAPPPSS